MALNHNINIGDGDSSSASWRARNDMALFVVKGKAEAIRSAKRLCFPLYHIKYCHSESRSVGTRNLIINCFKIIIGN
jgi:hypothetical protein